MPRDGNLFVDLLKIADGDVRVASDRLSGFIAFANSVQPSVVVANLTAREDTAAIPPLAPPPIAR